MIRTQRDGDVLTITLDRPEKKNAVTPEAMIDLRDLLRVEAADEGLRLLILAGAGDSFCAGYDIARIPDEPAEDGRMVGELDDAVRALAEFPAPTLAIVDGPAFGAGLELALACDLRMCSHRAKFCMPPAKLGLLYSLDGMVRLEQAVGQQRARQMIYTAQVLTAAEARASGLVLGVVEDLDRWLDEYLEHLRTMALGSLRGAKTSLRLAKPCLGADLVDQTEAIRARLFASDEAIRRKAASLKK